MEKQNKAGALIDLVLLRFFLKAVSDPETVDDKVTPLRADAYFITAEIRVHIGRPQFHAKVDGLSDI